MASFYFYSFCGHFSFIFKKKEKKRKKKENGLI